MDGLRWSDNICTVGWTCIHGFFTLADLKELKSLQPKGTLTPTFSGLNWHGEEEGMKKLEYEYADRDDHIGGFYFNFPWQGSEDLIAYLMMKDIKMERQVEGKVQQAHDAYWHGVMSSL